MIAPLGCSYGVVALSWPLVNKEVTVGRLREFLVTRLVRYHRGRPARGVSGIELLLMLVAVAVVAFVVLPVLRNIERTSPRPPPAPPASGLLRFGDSDVLRYGTAGHRVFRIIDERENKVCYVSNDGIFCLPRQ